MKFRLARFVCLLALLSPALRAQQAEPPAVSTTTELVLVPAQVKGHDGKPLLGLKAEDFVLRSDGKPQPIRVFEETMQSPRPARITTAPPATSNLVFNVPDGGMPEQILIIALDLVNTPFLDQTRARSDLLKYLTVQLPNQHFALVAITKDGLAQIHNFSSDPAVLVQALQKMQGTTTKDVIDEPMLESIIAAEQFGTSAGSPDVYRAMLSAYNETQIYGAFAQKLAARATLTALMQIAQAYAGVPGRKSVIWITAGMPTLIYDAFAGGVKGNSVLNGDPELLSDYNRAFAALNNANIAIYGVDVKGNKHDRSYEGTGTSQAIASRATSAKIYGPTKMIQPDDYQDDAIKVVSAATGGKSCTANLGLKDCMDAAVADSSTYYMLGFYVPQQDRKAGWHKLEVKLASERGSVRSRTEYYLASTTAPTGKEVAKTLREAAYARIGYTGLAFAVQREAPDAAKPGATGLRIFLPARSIIMTPGHPQLSYDLVSVSLDNKGEPATNLRVVHLNFNDEQTQSALNKGWSYVDQPDGAGKQPVKYILRDNGTGRIGSLIVLPQKAGG
jgi:VWFA-related protein